MRKIFLFILLFCSAVIANTQSPYPITQNLGSNNTLIKLGPTPSGAISGGLINMGFADTTAANLSPISFYGGAQIWSNSDSSLYVRMKSSTSLFWFKVGSASAGPTGGFWQIGVNEFPIVPASGISIGTGPAWGGSFSIKTNGVIRATVPDAGFSYVNDTTANKVMTWNPTTKEWGYGSWNGSGGNTIYTGNGTLSGNRTVSGGGNNLTWNNMGNISYNLANGKDFLVQNAREIFMGQSSGSAYSTQTFFNNGIYELAVSNTGWSSLFEMSDNALKIWQYGSTGTNRLSFGGSNGMQIDAQDGKISVDSIQRTTDTTSMYVVLRKQNAPAPDYLYEMSAADFLAMAGGGGSQTLQQVITTGATLTGDNTIVNGANQLEITNNDLAGTNGVYINSSTTAAASNAQLLFGVDLMGANANASQTTYTSYFTNTHTGTASTNIAAAFEASGGTINYAAKFYRGKTSFGTVGTESGILEINGSTSGTVTIQPAAAAGTPTLTLPTITGVIVAFNETNTASSATPTPTGGSKENYFDVTALATDATVAAPSGTPANHNTLVIRITSDATPRNLSWNAIYRASSDLALPSITVASKTMYVGFIYNSLSSTWDLVSVLDNF